MRLRTVIPAAVLIIGLAGWYAAASGGGGGTHRPVGRCGPCYVGVAAIRVSHLQAWQSATGVHVNLAEVYTTFGSMASVPEAQGIIADGALPLIQLDPYRTALSAIASGRDDRYLRRFASQIGALGHQVALSFAPEANGDWYTWGCHHTDPAIYVAAWRHVHAVVNRAAPGRIIWVWDVNHSYPRVCLLANRWPGGAYVDWVGLDGYWREPGDNFQDIIGATIKTIRGLTTDRILIAETGAPDVPQAASWIRSVFQGAETVPGVIGVVYFDLNDHDGRYRLEDDPPALAEFRRDARNYR